MVQKIPIRIRLSVGHAIWLAIIFVGIGIGISRTVEENILKSLDTALLASAKAIRDSQLSTQQRISAFHDSLYWEAMVDEFFGAKRYIRTYAQLVDTSGIVRAKTRNIEVNLPVTPMSLSRAERGQATFESIHLVSGTYLRQLTLPIMKGSKFTGEIIQVGSSMSASYSTINSVQIMLWLSLSLGFVFSIIFGYVLTKWSLQPVVLATKEVANFGLGGDFSFRLKLPKADDELRELVKTFNEMLGRIEDAFGRVRRFSGDVSHELRTPITVLRGEAELALRRTRSSSEYQSSLRLIMNEATLMSEILENLLLLARAQGEAISLHFEELEAPDFMASIVSSVQRYLDDKQLKVEIAVDLAKTQKIWASKLYLSLAIKNILLNAINHSLNGQVIKFQLDSEGKYYVFGIQDQGEGIPSESLPYIFDMFYRADTARNRTSGGAGIGLSLAKALIELHGGSIRVDSQYGRGSLFEVKLPQTNNSLKSIKGNQQEGRVNKIDSYFLKFLKRDNEIC